MTAAAQPLPAPINAAEPMAYTPPFSAASLRRGDLGDVREHGVAEPLEIRNSVGRSGGVFFGRVALGLAEMLLRLGHHLRGKANRVAGVHGDHGDRSHQQGLDCGLTTTHFRNQLVDFHFTPVFRLELPPDGHTPSSAGQWRALLARHEV